MQERWTGERLKPAQVEAISGITDIRENSVFEQQLHAWAVSGNYKHLYLDLYRVSPDDRDCPAHLLAKKAKLEYPYLRIENANVLIRSLRTIKQACEIEAMREAGLEPKRMRLVQQRAEKPAKLFLLEGKKGGRPGLVMEPVLLIEDETGAYSGEMKRIYGSYRKEQE